MLAEARSRFLVLESGKSPKSTSWAPTDAFPLTRWDNAIVPVHHSSIGQKFDTDVEKIAGFLQAFLLKHFISWLK
jgi:hypothetical protein